MLRLLLVEVQEPGALTEYTASPSGTVALELQPGATTTVRVTLRPEDDEVDLGSLRIVSDDPDEAVVVVPLLSSFKGTPILAVVPAALDFGVVPWGTSVVRDVDVSNVGTGNALLTVSSALITDTTGLGDAFSIEPFLVATGAPGETPTSFPVLLDPGGDRLRLRVTLATATLGAGPTPDEELVLTTDAVAPSDAERRIPLTGTVLGCAAPAAESCNGRDDDCDGTVDEGDPGSGGYCVTGALGLCRDGALHCLGAALGCVAVTAPAPEVCNTADDDCDGLADDGNPGGGAPCDGTDADLCAEGLVACAAGTLACSEPPGELLDLCNGGDDDCDGASPDGAEDPLVGTACDGTDGDLCAEGMRLCAAGVIVCAEGPAEARDLCGGGDDDCDPASADGGEDPLLGTACDGADGDLCVEGTLACVGAVLACSDATGTASESCNGADDDCDALTDEGPGLCGGGGACCGGGCVDPATSNLHCGGCNIACAPGTNCRSSVCTACTPSSFIIDIPFGSTSGWSSSSCCLQPNYRVAPNMGAVISGAFADPLPPTGAITAITVQSGIEHACFSDANAMEFRLNGTTIGTWGGGLGPDCSCGDPRVGLGSFSASASTWLRGGTNSVSILHNTSGSCHEAITSVPGRPVGTAFSVIVTTSCL